MSIAGKEVETMKVRIREHIRNNKVENCSPIAKPIICTDGFKVSVQASKHHYCSPREYDAEWASVELGFPSAADDLIQKYAETPDEPTETVYGYVPIDTVARLIIKHGGIKG